MARRTTTRSRRDLDEDYDETPDQSGAIGRYDDDEDEAPRRGRSRRSSREDEESPRRSSDRRSRSDDDDERPRRGRSAGRSRSDDEDERPRRRGRDEDADRPKRDRGSSTRVGRGWGSVDKMKGGGDFTNHWQVPEKPTLIKFLEPEPFTVFAEHFIEDLPKGNKKSFICLGDDCPLCDDLGDRPNEYAGFNILDLSDPDNPKVVYLRASRGLAKDIQVYAEDKRSKPINRWDVYFALHRKRESGARYKLEFVRARDVEDDYEFEPFDEVELEEFESDFINEDQVVFVDTRKRLKEIVDLVD